MKAVAAFVHVALALFHSTSSSSVSAEQVPLGTNSVADRRVVITPRLSAFVKDALHSASIPGLSIGIVRLDKDRGPAVETAAWGKQTEDGDGNDLTPDALFAIASCSKAFLVTAVGSLMEDYAHGRNATPLPGSLETFDWDTKIHRLLPDEWSFPEEWAEQSLNLRDAFSHLSGMPRHDYSYRPGDTAKDVIRRLKHLPSAHASTAPLDYGDSIFRYSWLSRILDPLNMTSSTFSPSVADESGKLTQTWTRGSRRVPFWFSDKVAELFAGAGGIISSAEDMTKWLAVLLNEGVDPLTNTTIIPPSVFSEMTTARTIVSGVPAGDLSIIGYGMGWFRMSYRGHDVVWHFGAIPGFSSLVAFLPSDNLGVVLLANMDEKQDDNMRILFRVIDEALGLPVNDAPPASHANIAQETMQDDEAVAKALPLDLKAYAGTYEDPAYGELALCTPSSTSEYCTRVLADFAAVDSARHTPLLGPSLFAAWDRVWSSHVRVRHTNGTQFAVTFPRLFPQGYGRNTTPFEFWDSQISLGRAEFVLEQGEVVGFALVTEEQAAAARATRTGGSLREIADAWFRRVM